MPDEIKNKSQVFRSQTIGKCANCSLEQSGNFFETVYGKRTNIRYEGYIGTAYDSFETKKVFLCDDCISKLYTRQQRLTLILSIVITLFASLLLVWPALNNFSGGHWNTGLVFVGISLVPILIFCLLYLPNFLRRMKYLKGNSNVNLNETQSQRMAEIAHAQGEKLAMKITREEVTADAALKGKGFNLFLTPAEYKILLKKTSPDLPTKK